MFGTVAENKACRCPEAARSRLRDSDTRRDPGAGVTAGGAAAAIGGVSRYSEELFKELQVWLWEENRERGDPWLGGQDGPS